MTPYNPPSHPRPARLATGPRPERMRRWTIWTIGLLAVMGLVAAACGDDTADTIDDATATAEEAAEDAGVDVDEAADTAEETAEDLADGADAEELDQQASELADALRANGMTTLASAIETIDIAELIGSEEFTLFGPDDEAFLSLTADDTADLLADPDQLATVLGNHVVDERLDSSALAGMTSVTTLNGEALPVVVDGETITIGGAAVVTADLDAGGGTIHVIDGVILP